MGEIVNYMQLDTGRMEQVIGTIHVCWDGPLQVLVSASQNLTLLDSRFSWKKYLHTSIISLLCNLK